MAVMLFAVVALLAAACSSSDDSSDTTVAADGATATTAAGSETTAASGSTDTTKASSGAAIESAITKDIQTVLAHLGYHTGPVDGIYGPHTISAIEAFQTDAGITVDGKYGPETHDALKEAAEGSDFNWDDFVAIKELQTQMADLGFYNGAIDGTYGPETEAGVKAVQAACSITQDGVYGPDTHSCLNDLGGDA